MHVKIQWFTSVLLDVSGLCATQRASEPTDAGGGHHKEKLLQASPAERVLAGRQAAWDVHRV